MHHEAKSIVKSHSKTKDTALIWKLTCKTCNKSMPTSLNDDAVPGWLTSARLDDGKWNQTQGEHITFCQDKVKKFNEMCPDSEINDMQGVRMLQNLTANVPNLANVPNFCVARLRRRQVCQTRSLCASLSLSFPNKPKFVTMEGFVQVATVVKALPTMNSIVRSMLTMSIKTKKKTSMHGWRQMQ